MMLVRLVYEMMGLHMEQGIVGIRHLPCKDPEPFLCNTPGIHVPLVVESYVKFAVLDLLSCLSLKRLEAVFKDMLAMYIEL